MQDIPESPAADPLALILPGRDVRCRAPASSVFATLVSSYFSIGHHGGGRAVDVVDANQTPRWEVTEARSLSAAPELRQLGRRVGRVETFPSYYLSTYGIDGGRVVIPDSSDQKWWAISDCHVEGCGPSRTVAGSAAFRAARELYYRCGEVSGALFLHAGCVAGSAGGAVLVGPKAAGKTTLLLAAATAGCSYVSNDRVRLSQKGDGWECATFPMALRVHPKSLANFEQWENVCEHNLSRPQAPTRWARSSGKSALYAPDDCKYELTSREVEIVLNVPFLNACTLDLLIFPQIDPADGISVSTICSADAVQLMRKELLQLADDTWLNPWILDARPFWTRKSLLEKLDHIATTTAAVRIRYGRRARDVLQAGQIVAELLGVSNGN